MDLFVENNLSMDRAPAGIEEVRDQSFRGMIKLCSQIRKSCSHQASQINKESIREALSLSADALDTVALQINSAQQNILTGNSTAIENYS
jgi:hypothetical protein